MPSSKVLQEGCTAGKCRVDTTVTSVLCMKNWPRTQICRQNVAKLRNAQLTTTRILPALPDKSRPGREKKPSFVERSLLGCAITDAPKLIPGVLLTVAIVAIAVSLGQWANHLWAYKGVVSFILIAILLGILLRNTVGLPELFQPGIGFAADKLLKLGIILLGIKLSFSGLMIISVWALPIIVGCILTGLVVSIYFTRLLKLPDRLGVLTAVGTSICGVAAIAAAAPGIKAKDDEVAYAIANITVFGIIAMFVYPYLAALLFGGDVLQAGLFVGTAIHNTAQVAGAGLVYDQSFASTASAGVADVAVITKLVRNLMMVAVIPLMAFVYAHRAAGQGIVAERSTFRVLHLIPVFIIGFLMMAALRSVGDAGLGSSGLALGVWEESAWRSLHSNIAGWSNYTLAAAMAGVGLGTSFSTLKGLGVKPFAVGLVAAATVGLTSVILVLILVH